MGRDYLPRVSSLWENVKPGRALLCPSAWIGPYGWHSIIAHFMPGGPQPLEKAGPTTGVSLSTEEAALLGGMKSEGGWGGQG